MRSRFLVRALCLALIATVGLTGCNFFKKHPKTGAEGQVPPLGEGAGTIPSSEPAHPLGLTDANLDHSQFTADIVYFDFDSARIRPGEVSKLEAVAAWMKSNPDKKLVVEGYCDERGTAEYNRALGERRAEAAREELVRRGVDANRISTNSYGKDRAADPGHDEAAWAKNRRCEFAVVK
jgi:peptidoglycan-associated lipoprotein